MDTLPIELIQLIALATTSTNQSQPEINAQSQVIFLNEDLIISPILSIYDYITFSSTCKRIRRALVSQGSPVIHNNNKRVQSTSIVPYRYLTLNASSFSLKLSYSTSISPHDIIAIGIKRSSVSLNFLILHINTLETTNYSCHGIVTSCILLPSGRKISSQSHHKFILRSSTTSTHPFTEDMTHEVDEVPLYCSLWNHENDTQSVHVSKDHSQTCPICGELDVSDWVRVIDKRYR